MNQNQSPEIHDFITGSTDERAIQDYLAIQDDGEIARLAALMAPRQGTFNPATLVDAAIALQTETKAGLIRRREAIVATMNYSTLLALQQALGFSLCLYVDDDDERLLDPIVGPVLGRLHSTVSAGFKQSDALENERIASVLACADKRANLSRPSLPCDLEDALRYATNSPRVPWPALQSAFMDFLGVSRNTRDQEQRDDDEESLRNQIEHTARIIAGLKKNLKNDSQTLASTIDHERKLQKLQDDLVSLEALKCYCENFEPGVYTPPNVAKESSAIFAEYWQQSQSVKSDRLLAWFSSEFYSFWEKHRIAYQKLHTATEKAKSAKAKTHSKAASLAAKAREKAKWLKHTRDFVKFANDNKSPARDSSELIETFAAAHCGLGTIPAQIKVREFLGMLSSYANRDFDTCAIIGGIRKSGIKALSDNAIRECHSLLKTACERPSSKKIEKIVMKQFSATSAVKRIK